MDPVPAFRNHLPVQIRFGEGTIGALGEVVAGEGAGRAFLVMDRSEEHTSELQSRQYIVCRLLLEKKTNQVKLITCRIYTSFISFFSTVNTSESHFPPYIALCTPPDTTTSPQLFF